MTASASITVVIPVFNRDWCVRRALASATAFLAAVDGGEIIVVDDGSTDRTVQEIQDFLAAHRHDSVRVRLIEKGRNMGVCAAKNSGALAASGTWVLFLDSDDELVTGSARPLVDALLRHATAPLHFFRCLDERGQLVGENASLAITRGFNEFVLHGTSGECLPVVARPTFVRYRYDEDINGFEGLCYLRIVREASPAMIHPLAARVYHTSHPNRLSSRAGVRSRAASIAKGYLRMLREHHDAMSARSFAAALLRFAYHGGRSLVA